MEFVTDGRRQRTPLNCRSILIMKATIFGTSLSTWLTVTKVEIFETQRALSDRDVRPSLQAPVLTVNPCLFEGPTNVGTMVG